MFQTSIITVGFDMTEEENAHEESIFALIAILCRRGSTVAGCVVYVRMWRGQT